MLTRLSLCLVLVLTLGACSFSGSDEDSTPALIDSSAPDRTGGSTADPTDGSTADPTEGPVTDSSEFAGLWDASVTLPDGGRDERYVSLSTGGRYTEYDYRQDDAADDGNCHFITALTLEAIGERDFETSQGGGMSIDADGSFIDNDPISISATDVPTYRLSDGRVVSLFATGSLSSDTVTDEEGSLLTDEDALPALYAVFEAGTSAQTSEGWSQVEGQVAADLVSCDAP